MSDSRTTATPEKTNATSTDHPPVRMNQNAIIQERGSANEAEVERGAIAGQRVMRTIGGGSPAVPPEQFAEALGWVTGRSQVGLWRQMQRGYGNNYVGKVIQAKLTVNQPGDSYEQEADRMAAQVMATPQSDQSIQREIDPEKEKEKIQMKPSLQRASDGNLEAGGNLEGRLNSSKGGGSPLPDDVRSFMEPRFGADFSQVRVHTGGESVQMNQDLNAQAFTHRQDVYFGAGKAPAQDALTAHELTHVIQQSEMSKANSSIQLKPENERPLGDIQGLAMYDLLPELNKLPKNILDDEQAGNFVGGTRLVLAMRVVKLKDVMQWNTFVQDNNSTLSTLFDDQVLDICNFLNSKDAHRWYIQEKLHKKFESEDSIEKVDWNKLKQEEIDERVKAGSKEGTTGYIKGKAFVVYLNEIKVIKSTNGKYTGFSWLCNNPGSLLGSGDKIRSIGTFGSFFIFPTFETGQLAARRNLLDGKGAYPDDSSILATMKTYAPGVTDNPDTYANTVIRELTRVNSLHKDLREPVTKDTTTMGEVRKAIEKHKEYLDAFYGAIRETEGTTNRLNQGAILKRGGGINDSAGVNITDQEKTDLLLKLE